MFQYFLAISSERTDKFIARDTSLKSTYKLVAHFALIKDASSSTEQVKLVCSKYSNIERKYPKI